MFGATPPQQNEEAPTYARSLNGAAKFDSNCVTHNYREGNGMFTVDGILLHHESPRRGENYDTHKIKRKVA